MLADIAGGDEIIARRFGDFLQQGGRIDPLARRIVAVGAGRRGEFAAGGAVSREIAPGLALDESRHALAHGETIIDLSAREYALLAHLMRNRGAALTRQQLLDEVWGAEPDVYSNVVDLYIHYLRDKFAEAGYDDLIKTVRGVGYRLTAEHAA